VIAQLVPDLDGAVIVTIPSEVSQFIVKKSVVFLSRELKIPLLGLVENMSGGLCPHCGGGIELFETSSGGPGPLQSTGLPLLGRVPFDRRVAAAGDRGESFVDRHAAAPAAQAFESIARLLEEGLSLAGEGRV
jgi:ATP-binding protein involved in chromosome partitioning